MREIKLGADAGGIAELFEDIEQLLTRCRFSDCRHQGDAGCAVDSALATGTLNVRRWQNYQKLMAESEMSRLTKLEQKRKKENWGKQIAKLTRDVKKRKRPDG